MMSQQHRIIEVPLAILEKVIYYSKDGFYAEPHTVVRAGRSIEELAHSALQDAYGFEIVKVIEGEMVFDGHTVPVSSQKPFDVSPMIFLGGTVYTLDEMRTAHPDMYTFIENVAQRGPQFRAIRTCAGIWQPFAPDDMLLVVEE